MTHDNVKIKFLIEYDKANVTSSYPSLTDYEIATILDKAYLALIARKFTGNNTRRIPFEYDIKSIEDLRPLIKTVTLASSNTQPISPNEKVYKLQPDHLYFIEGHVKYTNEYKQVAEIVSHKIAEKFRSTDSNLPWVKRPVVFLEGDEAHILVDEYKRDDVESFTTTYIGEPASFIGFSGNFELSDTMAEELISLAITFALENVESSRLQTKISTLPLEG